MQGHYSVDDIFAMGAAAKEFGESLSMAAAEYAAPLAKKHNLDGRAVFQALAIGYSMNLAGIAIATNKLPDRKVHELSTAINNLVNDWLEQQNAKEQ